jgi:UDP-2,3-diacylglucosamine pyrophosphatase LpxH
MKIGFLSDIHFGDPSCRLVEKNEKTDTYQLAGTYQTLKDRIEKFTGESPLDYLVLNGDILDFSVNSFEESCKAASPFFKAIKQDDLAKQIVYIPGNHDKYVWDAVEWEVSVIRRLKLHAEPEPFKKTQPCLIDHSQGRMVLPGVRPIKGTRDEYGTLFLEGLFEKDNALHIILVYPNLYIKTSSDIYLITHGHMLETAWVVLSELLSGEPELVKTPGVAQLEEYNIPLTSMICTGVGQAGRVSDLFRTIQQEAKRGKITRLRSLLGNMIPRFGKVRELSWPAELLISILLRALRKAAVYIAKGVKDSRYDIAFFTRESVRRRFKTFYAASCAQAENEHKLAPPNKMILGHTHEPFSEKDPMEIKDLPEIKGRKAFLYNTGGWLRAEGKSAEVFFLDDNGILSSSNIP